MSKRGGGCHLLLGIHLPMKSYAAISEALHVQYYLYNIISFPSIIDVHLPNKTTKKSFCQMIIDSARVQYRVHWGLSNYT